MVRRHGWQLPAHTFQVVAITVFFLLVVAFYAFFAPFLGKRIFEYASIAVYTPVALTVFILYVRCTRINPADPGIMFKFDDEFINIPKNNPGMPDIGLPDNYYNNSTGSHSSPSSACRSSLDGNPNKKASPGGDVRINIPVGPPRKSRSHCCRFGGFICALFVKEDCRKPETTEHQASVEDALFCTLCNAEVARPLLPASSNHVSPPPTSPMIAGMLPLPSSDHGSPLPIFPMAAGMGSSPRSFASHLRALPWHRHLLRVAREPLCYTHPSPLPLPTTPLPVGVDGGALILEPLHLS